jgi:predicted ABC-type ATPase
MRLADEAVVLDNSGSQPERLLTLQGGQIWRAKDIPLWVEDLVPRLE